MAQEVAEAMGELAAALIGQLPVAVAHLAALPDPADAVMPVGGAPHAWVLATSHYSTTTDAGRYLATALWQHGECSLRERRADAGDQPPAPLVSASGIVPTTTVQDRISHRVTRPFPT